MKLINRLFIILISCLLSSVALAKDLTVGLKSEPSSIDPHYHNLGPNNAFATHIYGTLVGSDENQQHYPDLATSWKPINDTTWEFKLRKGVKFHDGSDLQLMMLSLQLNEHKMFQNLHQDLVLI